MSCVDNKTNYKNARKPHGQILLEINAELTRLMTIYHDAYLLREEALAMVARSAKTIQVLHKVVGLSDMLGWRYCQHGEFDEISPKTVKRLLTGDANADKDVVAAALEPYVGKVDYECDDESDAVAVGVAWMIQNYMLGDVDECIKDSPRKTTTASRSSKGTRQGAKTQKPAN